jgi:hypothetical protein
MENCYIKSRTITELKTRVKGKFVLSDKSITKFEIDRKTGEWNQWGNSTDNLCISVEAIEKLTEQYLIC